LQKLGECRKGKEGAGRNDLGHMDLLESYQIQLVNTPRTLVLEESFPKNLV